MGDRLQVQVMGPIYLNRRAPGLLLIREAQFNAMLEDRWQTFATAAVGSVRRHLPEDFDRLGEPGVLALLAPALRKSRRYGLVRDCDVLGFLTLLAAMGPDFDEREENQWMRDILANHWMAAEGKVGLILDEWAFRLDEEAKSLTAEIAAIDKELNEEPDFEDDEQDIAEALEYDPVVEE